MLFSKDSLPFAFVVDVMPTPNGAVILEFARFDTAGLDPFKRIYGFSAEEKAYSVLGSPLDEFHDPLISYHTGRMALIAMFYNKAVVPYFFDQGGVPRQTFGITGADLSDLRQSVKKLRGSIGDRGGVIKLPEGARGEKVVLLPQPRDLETFVGDFLSHPFAIPNHQRFMPWSQNISPIYVTQELLPSPQINSQGYVCGYSDDTHTMTRVVVAGNRKDDAIDFQVLGGYWREFEPNPLTEWRGGATGAFVLREKSRAERAVPDDELGRIFTDLRDPLEKACLRAIDASYPQLICDLLDSEDVAHQLLGASLVRTGKMLRVINREGYDQISPRLDKLAVFNHGEHAGYIEWLRENHMPPSYRQPSSSSNLSTTQKPQREDDR